MILLLYIVFDHQRNNYDFFQNKGTIVNINYFSKLLTTLFKNSKASMTEKYIQKMNINYFLT